MAPHRCECPQWVGSSRSANVRFGWKAGVRGLSSSRHSCHRVGRSGERMFRDNFNRWLRAPLLTGPTAIFCVIIALALPTSGARRRQRRCDGLRVHAVPTFRIRLCRDAKVVAGRRGRARLGSNPRRPLEGPPRHMLALPCFLPSAGMFLAASAGMIAMAVLVRHVVARLQKPDNSSGGIILAWRRARFGRAGAVMGSLCGWEPDTLSPT